MQNTLMTLTEAIRTWKEMRDQVTRDRLDNKDFHARFHDVAAVITEALRTKAISYAEFERLTSEGR